MTLTRHQDHFGFAVDFALRDIWYVIAITSALITAIVFLASRTSRADVYDIVEEKQAPLVKHMDDHFGYIEKNIDGLRSDFRAYVQKDDVAHSNH